MSLASLGVGAPAWRAARAVASLGAVRRGQFPADDALDALAQVGRPDVGWWEVMGEARKAPSLGMILPRPGDPRGVAFPRGVVAEAAVGWGDEHMSTWLLPLDDGAWHAVELAGQGLMTQDPDEADRRLRAVVVQLAHLVDVTPAPERGPLPAERQALEATVDAWVLEPPCLPAQRRQLASMGLRMLLALDGEHPLAHTAPLEEAARNAVEAAFSCTRSHG